MKNFLAMLFLPLLSAGSPAYAQSPCLECLKAAEAELKTCIANAISVEDKNSCEDNKEEQQKTCEDSECKVEREHPENKIDVPSQER
jgi:hypothetical protein